MFSNKSERETSGIYKYSKKKQKQNKITLTESVSLCRQEVGRSTLAELPTSKFIFRT